MFNNRRRIIIFAALILAIGGLLFLGSRQPTTPGEKTYTDPNNGETVVDSTPRDPETAASDGNQLTITGRKELIDQGLEKETVDYLDSFFKDYNKNITYVSIVTNSVVQSRDSTTSDFIYTFQVQIDRKDYYTVVIDSKDSETGVARLYTKDKKTLLKEQEYYNSPAAAGDD